MTRLFVLYLPNNHAGGTKCKTGWANSNPTHLTSNILMAVHGQKAEQTMCETIIGFVLRQLEPEFRAHVIKVRM